MLALSTAHFTLWFTEYAKLTFLHSTQPTAHVFPRRLLQTFQRLEEAAGAWVSVEDLKAGDEMLLVELVDCKYSSLQWMPWTQSIMANSAKSKCSVEAFLEWYFLWSFLLWCTGHSWHDFKTPVGIFLVQTRYNVLSQWPCYIHVCHVQYLLCHMGVEGFVLNFVS